MDKKSFDKEVMRVTKITSILRLQLLHAHPFYGYALNALDDPIAAKISTMATDGLNIFFNPCFTVELTQQHLNFILLHELFHVILMHCTRKGTRDNDLWNQACDYIINYELMQLRNQFSSQGIFMDFVEGGLLAYDGAKLRDFSETSAEALYDELSRQAQTEGSAGSDDNQDFSNVSQEGSSGSDSSEQNQQSGQQASQQNSQSSGSAQDSHVNQNSSGGQGAQSADSDELKEFENAAASIGDNLSNDIQEPNGNTAKTGEIEAKVAGIIQSAMQLAKSQGLGASGMMSRTIELIKPKRINWRTYLKRFLTSLIGEDSSYLTPERKYLPYDLIIPGAGEEEKLDDLWVFIDSSGSISDKEIANFLSQVAEICKQFDAVLNIAYWDTSVHDIYNEVELNSVKECIPTESGGTDIACAFRYIEKNKLKACAFLFCTDGYTPVARGVRSSITRRTIIALSEQSKQGDALSANGKLVNLY